MLDTGMRLKSSQILPVRGKIAALDVDAQKCFTNICPNELPVPEGESIVAALNRQARLAAVRIGSKDAHPAGAIWEADTENPPLSVIEGRNVDVRWPRHGVPGTVGFQLLPGLPEPTEYDFFVWKGVEPDMHPYGCCYHDLSEQLSTGVIEFLKTRQIETVLVGGLAFDYCVKTSALQLVRAGFQVIVNKSATRSLSPESGLLAAQEMTAAGITIVDDIDQLQLSA